MPPEPLSTPLRLITIFTRSTPELWLDRASFALSLVLITTFAFGTRCALFGNVLSGRLFAGGVPQNHPLCRSNAGRDVLRACGASSHRGYQQPSCLNA